MASRRSFLRTSAAAVGTAALTGSRLGSAQGPAEVRWLQWKTSEVGEKHMADLKAAFEKAHPEARLTLVDSPFTGFHDKAITLFQAQKLALGECG